MLQSVNGNYLSSELHHLQPQPLWGPHSEEQFNTTDCKAALYCTQSAQCTTIRVPPSVTPCYHHVYCTKNKCWTVINCLKMLKVVLATILVSGKKFRWSKTKQNLKLFFFLILFQYSTKPACRIKQALFIQVLKEKHQSLSLIMFKNQGIFYDCTDKKLESKLYLKI